MTQEMARAFEAACFYLVQVHVFNVHEMRRLESRLEKVGTVLYSGYVHGADDWYRPTIRSAFYVVLVPRSRVQALKAMLTLFNKNNESQVSYRSLQNGI